MNARPYGKVYTIVRILLGITFVVNSPIGVFDRSMFASMGGTGEVLTVLWNAGYLMYLVKAVELSVGLALLSNRLVPLALIIITPILITITLVQSLSPMGPALGIGMGLLAVYLAWTHRATYQPLFRFKPAAPPPHPAASLQSTGAAS